MKFLKNILIYIWSGWFLLVVALLCLILFPLLLLAVLSSNERIIKAAHYVPTGFARVALTLAGIRIEIRNKEQIDPVGQYVYVSNHRSYLDGIIAGAVLPGYVKFLGKAEMLKWPVIGYLLGKYYVPVWRQDKAHRSWSMEQMEEKIRTGCSFFICPEGTCNTTEGFFIRFYNGAFRLSGETGIPLVPLTFIGSGEVMPRNTLLLRPGRVIVYWHAPMPASAFVPDRLEPGKEKVREIMRQDLLKHYPAGTYDL